ncbi:hypothetical protein [Rubripirellula reticaptiva]|uniref:hypothetical protein n=1 Tax=Rubripirellula reticaptiva TaxID=2528013 RepID=UPI0011B5565E|nr:hypothetical protein [Rubripirellula reticaptiva]
MVDVHFGYRDKESLGTSKQRRGQALETGEGQQWPDGYRKGCEDAERCPGTQVVSLVDREGDVYDIFVEADKHLTPAEFVIRSQRKCSLPEKDFDGVPGDSPAPYTKTHQGIGQQVNTWTRRSHGEAGDSSLADRASCSARQAIVYAVSGVQRRFGD